MRVRTKRLDSFLTPELFDAVVAYNKAPSNYDVAPIVHTILTKIMDPNLEVCRFEQQLGLEPRSLKSIVKVFAQMLLWQEADNVTSVEQNEEHPLSEQALSQVNSYAELSAQYNLAGKQVALLHVLLQHPNRVITKTLLLDAIYPNDPNPPMEKIIDVFICKLRAKLKQAKAPYEIETVWGLGVRLRHIPQERAEHHAALCCA